jgi:hypothetical protein
MNSLRFSMAIALTALNTHATTIDEAYANFANQNARCTDLLSSVQDALATRDERTPSLPTLLDELSLVALGISSDLKYSSSHPVQAPESRQVPGLESCESPHLAIALYGVGMRNKIQVIDAQLCYADKYVAVFPELKPNLCGYRMGLLADQQIMLKTVFDRTGIGTDEIEKNKTASKDLAAQCLIPKQPL